MSAVGGYTLHLYCDTPETIPVGGISKIHPYGWFPREFNGEFGSECRANAKKAGWTFHRDGTTICPICNGKLTKEQAIKKRGY